MDNKESERITNEDVPSVKEKSDSPDDEDLKEESPSNEDPEVCEHLLVYTRGDVLRVYLCAHRESVYNFC
jgi:hypothetical protein